MKENKQAISILRNVDGLIRVITRVRWHDLVEVTVFGEVLFEGEKYAYPDAGGALLGPGSGNASTLFTIIFVVVFIVVFVVVFVFVLVFIVQSAIQIYWSWGGN